MKTSLKESEKDRLATPIQYVKGVGPKLSKILDRKGIHTVEDALYFLPRSYEDRRDLRKVSELEAGRKETGFGEVLLSGFAFYAGRRKRVFEVVVGDGSGVLTLKWFHGNGQYLMGRFKKGRRLIFSGEVRWFNHRKEIHHPDVEPVEDEVEIDFDSGKIINKTSGKTYNAKPFPPFMQDLIKKGGLMEKIKSEL